MRSSRMRSSRVPFPHCFFCDVTGSTGPECGDGWPFQVVSTEYYCDPPNLSFHMHPVWSSYFRNNHVAKLIPQELLDSIEIRFGAMNKIEFQMPLDNLSCGRPRTPCAFHIQLPTDNVAILPASSGTITVANLFVAGELAHIPKQNAS